MTTVKQSGPHHPYQASRIKRHHATKAEVAERRKCLRAIIAEMRPMTVRQVFYQASVRGLVGKSEACYAKVQTDLVRMRRSGALPYDWLADNTRWQRKPTTFTSVEQALRETAQFYRKALWAEIEAYVEIWLEMDALAGVVLPVTSLSFLHKAAEHIAGLDVPAYIYHLGDFDPSGVNAGEKIEETLRSMAPEAEIHFERIAVTPSHISAWNLPIRPTKASDSRARSFGNISVELDAIAPDDLRELVRAAIEHHLPDDQFAVLKAADESERRMIAGLVGMLPATAVASVTAARMGDERHIVGLVGKLLNACDELSSSSSPSTGSSRPRSASRRSAGASVRKSRTFCSPGRSKALHG